MNEYSKDHSLDLLFNPKTVVIHEAKDKISYFIEGFIRQGFNLNNLFLINPSEESLLGLKCYKSIAELPIDTIDYLIFAIRREIALEELKKILSLKTINFIHLFTAGLGESDEVGSQIEKEIKNVLDSYPVRAIGPNCMGIYSPSGKNAYYSSFPIEPGNIGLIFQSGDLHSRMIKFGSQKYNLRFSKGVSVGNCVDLQIADFLEYYEQDPNTEIICVYLEGFSPLYPDEPKHFLEVIKKLKKPVLFMRGGRTERAQQAVISHTGSLATNQKIWQAIYKQTHLIEVPPSLEDLLDLAYMFKNYLARFQNQTIAISFPTTKHALVVLWSGGFGILATDVLTELGIAMPQFKGETLKALKKIYPLKIGSLSNPLDMPWITSRKEFSEICIEASKHDIDFIVVETDAWSDIEGERFKIYYNGLKAIKGYVESTNKVFSIILHQYPSNSREKFHEMLIKDNFLVFPTVERAAKAFLKLHEYGKKLREKQLKQFH